MQMNLKPTLTNLENTNSTFGFDCKNALVYNKTALL